MTGWRRSKRGNLWRELGGFSITVVPSRNTFKCLVYGPGGVSLVDSPEATTEEGACRLADDAVKLMTAQMSCSGRRTPRRAPHGLNRSPAIPVRRSTLLVG